MRARQVSRPQADSYPQERPLPGGIHSDPFDFGLWTNESRR